MLALNNDYYTISVVASGIWSLSPRVGSGFFEESSLIFGTGWAPKLQFKSRLDLALALLRLIDCSPSVPLPIIERFSVYSFPDKPSIKSLVQLQKSILQLIFKFTSLSFSYDDPIFIALDDFSDSLDHFIVRSLPEFREC